MDLTPGKKKYLLAVKKLSDKGEARISGLAEMLGCRKPSVCKTVSALEKMGLVNQSSYGPVKLTQKGRVTVEKIADHAEKMSMFFRKVLCCSDEETAQYTELFAGRVEENLAARIHALSELALSSEAWLKRLKYRITVKLNTAEEDAV